MKSIINSIRSINAPIFGLIAMVFGLFQMYAKVYYIINPYPINVFLDLAIALIVASGFAIATTIIIVHSKNANTAYLFAFFDFFGYVLYFGNSAAVWYANSEFAKIGGAVFIAMLSAVIIYNFGEIFISQLRDNFTEATSIQKINAEYNTERAGLLAKIAEVQNAFSNTSLLLRETETALDNSQKTLSKTEVDFEKLKNEMNTETSIRITTEKSLSKLEEQKKAFVSNTTEAGLKGTLDGYKRAYTRALREDRTETAKDMQEKMIATASILNVKLEEQYLNNFTLFKSEA